MFVLFASEVFERWAQGFSGGFMKGALIGAGVAGVAALLKLFKSGPK
jgi:hypothetical protein